ncbi:origin recognition complex subunit 1-like [Panonychus citri]|uniref:origin recognition complex subunit 1-like n=1 Tax=Panonychus citri TaxID=50023 RepID=UPI002307A946|nr:origin recognition complex subunit 1-like [Panonychus citri]
MEPGPSEDQPKRKLIRANLSLKLSTSLDDEDETRVSGSQSTEKLEDPFSELEDDDDDEIKDNQRREEDDRDSDDSVTAEADGDDEDDDAKNQQYESYIRSMEPEYDNYDTDDNDDYEDKGETNQLKDEQPDAKLNATPMVKFSDRLLGRILKLSNEAKSSSSGLPIKGSTLASKLRSTLESFESRHSSADLGKGSKAKSISGKINVNQDTRGWYEELMSFISSQDNFEPSTMTLDSLQKLRSVICKGERESLSVTKELESDLANKKICFVCLKVRFGLVKWPAKCKICSQVMCDKCSTLLHLPSNQKMYEVTVDQIELTSNPKEIVSKQNTIRTMTIQESTEESIGSGGKSNINQGRESISPNSSESQSTSFGSTSPLPPPSPRHLPGTSKLPNLLKSLSTATSSSGAIRTAISPEPGNTIKICLDCYLFMGKLRKMKSIP